MTELMQQFIGTKLIRARPMNRADYNVYRGWQLPANENGADDGFLVEYLDGGQANDYRHQGYISWSPKAVFKKAYRPVTGMTFGMAIEALKAGAKVAREGWNGKGMWLVMVPARFYQVPALTAPNKERPFGLDLQPFIGMKTAQDMFVPWLASQSDMLGEDWMVVS